MYFIHIKNLHKATLDIALHLHRWSDTARYASLNEILNLYALASQMTLISFDLSTLIICENLRHVNKVVLYLKHC